MVGGNMNWYILTFIAGALVGGFIGALVMCCCVAVADRKNDE
jgi:glycerol uptake facilitator-like aquaporin